MNEKQREEKSGSQIELFIGDFYFSFFLSFFMLILLQHHQTAPPYSTDNCLLRLEGYV